MLHTLQRKFQIHMHLKMFAVRCQRDFNLNNIVGQIQAYLLIYKSHTTLRSFYKPEIF